MTGGYCLLQGREGCGGCGRSLNSDDRPKRRASALAGQTFRVTHVSPRRRDVSSFIQDIPNMWDVRQKLIIKL